MNPWLAYDLRALLVGALAWAAFLGLVGAAWGLFVPLALASLIIPAVLVGSLEGPQLLRPVLGIAPSALACACLAVLPATPDSWQPLILELIGGGAGIVFLALLPRAIWRTLRPDSSSVAKPLGGSA